LARVRLNENQINTLLGFVRDIVNYINEFNIDDADLDCIKQIQIPSRLSENIALSLCENGFIDIGFEALKENFKFGVGVNDYDIEYDIEGEENIRIEVKATGTNIFQRFRQHALQSDYTIWIDFHGLRNEGGRNTDYSVYFFKTIDVFREFINRNEKEMSVTKLIEDYQLIPIDID
jgi:hypothetical protein